MSPENKVVLNRRGGESFRQLYIDKEIPLASRVKISVRHFGVEVREVVNVLKDVREVLLDSQEAAFSKEEREKHLGRGLNNYFKSRLRDLGISYAHSTNLVLGVADHLALADGAYGSESWRYTRHNLLHKLHGKIR